MSDHIYYLYIHVYYVGCYSIIFCVVTLAGKCLLGKYSEIFVCMYALIIIIVHLQVVDIYTSQICELFTIHGVV